MKEIALDMRGQKLIVVAFLCQVKRQKYNTDTLSVSSALIEAFHSRSLGLVTASYRPLSTEVGQDWYLMTSYLFTCIEMKEPSLPDS